jgi:CRISPR-associated exonuclease Cas4
MEAADPIMLSALQHWSYCPRQCALIHVEQAFDENVFTMRGNAAHERVDDPGFETFEGVRAERALPVWSDRLGLIGKCDVVEFHPDGHIYPVEYKHGSELGNAPAHNLFELVQVQKNTDELACDFADYTVTVKEADIPAGVTLQRKVG